MKIKFYGTRGSVPIAGPSCQKYGGNTTCLRVFSECLPAGLALVVDSGTGYVPLSADLAIEGVKAVHLFQTHWHHDHTQGLLLAKTTFMPNVKHVVWGPVERGMGGQKIFQTLMEPPFHPVSFKHRLVGSHFEFRDYENPNAEVIIIHPKGGVKRLTADTFERLERDTQTVKFGVENGAYKIGECLVIRMLLSNHPEYTVCYRFEERPTGKVFVFLTDHENTDSLPGNLRGHLSKASLLVMDSQYKREVYDRATAGFGHGTPDYCVRVAHMVGAERLGLTHHDPFATDKDIDDVLEEGLQALATLVAGPGASISPKGGNDQIFAIPDYRVVEL